LIEEVRRLLDKGYSPESRPLRSIGYRHIALYLRGEMSLDEAVPLMKRDTRRLAKRQLTWFRADEEIRWFHPEKQREEILDSIELFLSPSHFH
jgi:tRNA dimethylallyltransferase